MKGIQKIVSQYLVFSVALCAVFFLFQVSPIEAKTKYRQRFSEDSEAIQVDASVEPVEKEEKKTVKKEQEEIPEQDDEAIRQQKLQQDALELQKQKAILEKYKPLIKPRTYNDLLVVSEWVPDLKLNRLPELNEEIIPGRAPNIRLIPYLFKSFAHPAYKSKLNGVSYYLAVNCDSAYGFDDCSTIPHNAFRQRSVFVRFIQSSDPNFKLVNGMRVGNTFSQVEYLFDEDAEIHGDGECVKTRQEWLACFDGNKLSLNKKRLQMMPAKDSRLLRFMKISGRGY